MNKPTDSKPMVMTVLEGHVEPDKWANLQEAFTAGASHLPPQMVQTMLVQSTKDSTLWQGISIWRSREALGEYRKSVETPEGILLFRSVGAEPQLTIYEITSLQQH